MLASIEFQSTQGIIHRLDQANLHPADRLCDSLECTEINHHEVVDCHAGHFFNGFKGAAGATKCHGFVEFPAATAHCLAVHLAFRQVNQRISRNTDSRCGRAVSVDVQQDRGVGSLRGPKFRSAAITPVVFTHPRVATHQHHIKGSGFAGDFIDYHGFGACDIRSGLLGDIQGGDVALELIQHCGCPGTDRGHRQNRPTCCGSDNSRPSFGAHRIRYSFSCSGQVPLAVLYSKAVS